MARWWLVAAVLLLGCGGDVCDAASLRAALGSARSGDVVRVGACRIEGVEATVPAGVTLRGASKTASILAGSNTVLTLSDGAIVDSLAIESESTGIDARAGSVQVQDVELHVHHGVGMRVAGASATLERVRVIGSVQPDTLPPDATPAQGSLGLVVSDAPSLSLTDFGIELTGPWGCLVANSGLTWIGGSVSENVGTAIYLDGGTATITDVQVHNALQGLQPLPAYGLVATGGARVTASNLTVMSSEGLGVLVDRSSGTFDTVAVEDARFGGIWVQDSTDVSLARLSLSANGLAGVTSLASAIAIDGGTIQSTVERVESFSDLGGIRAGDGISIVSPSGPTRIANVELLQHARIGLMLDVSGSMLSQVTLASVAVDGPTLGCLAQDMTGLVPTGGWDDGVTRRGATAANDLAQTAVLQAIAPIAARNVPSIDPRLLGM